MSDNTKGCFLLFLSVVAFAITTYNAGLLPGIIAAIVAYFVGANLTRGGKYVCPVCGKKHSNKKIWLGAGYFEGKYFDGGYCEPQKTENADGTVSAVCSEKCMDDLLPDSLRTKSVSEEARRRVGGQ